jgi:hypothetical protein
MEDNAHQAQKEKIMEHTVQSSEAATSLNASGSEDTQTNLIMPEPTIFLSRKFPAVSIIRPTQIAGCGGAVATIKSFTADGLFIGQSQEFFAVLNQLAQQADAARRG